MANLVIDIGNTNTKIAVFDNYEMVHTDQHQSVTTEILDAYLNNNAVERAIISTVKNKSEDWEDHLKNKIRVTYFNKLAGKTINNKYLTPETLGADRLAAVIGANYLYPGANSLVIDAGTCITYDLIDSEANYFGGSISPGLKMRYNALNHYTSGLPLINGDQSFNSNYGNNTTTAIQSGVQNGITYELNGFIESYINKYHQLNIILTGGDSIFFDTLLKNSIFAPYIKMEPHLVLKGLNVAIQKA